MGRWNNRSIEDSANIHSEGRYAVGYRQSGQEIVKYILQIC